MTATTATAAPTANAAPAATAASTATVFAGGSTVRPRQARGHLLASDLGGLRHLRNESL